jgi:GTP1/Obg family GTP-binding protein
LYSTLRPLFKNKPLIVVFTKADIKRVENLPQNKQEIIEKWLKENNLISTTISTMTG